MSSKGKNWVIAALSVTLFGMMCITIGVAAEAERQIEVYEHLNAMNEAIIDRAHERNTELTRQMHTVMTVAGLKYGRDIPYLDN